MEFNTYFAKFTSLYTQTNTFELILELFICNLQANAKEMFEDDDLDVSSGSDFDEDEDPDKIEVPGKLIYTAIS